MTQPSRISDVGEHNCRKRYNDNFFKMKEIDFCIMVCKQCRCETTFLGPEDGHEPSAIIIGCINCGQGIGYFSCEINYQHD